MKKNTIQEKREVNEIASLFDGHGRRVSQGLAAPANPVSRRYFQIEQPELDVASIFERISRHLGRPSSLTCDEFVARVDKLQTVLKETPALANMMQGVHVPFFLPASRHEDMGETLEKHYIASVQASFLDAFPPYEFANHNAVSLSGTLQIQPGSRHDVLIDKMSKEDVVGCYFPCLTEFSVPAAIEQMNALPEGMALAGGYDTCAALVGSPSLLRRTAGYSNMLWLAALRTQDENVGHYFEPYGLNLTFNSRPHFGQVSEYWASGITVFG